eukprot:158946-Prorocentrum_minimum.AAC.1
MLSPHAWLGCTPGICSLPTRGWVALREYALSPRVVGLHSGNMLSPRAWLGRTPGICSLPARDWVVGWRANEPRQHPCSGERQAKRDYTAN